MTRIKISVELKNNTEYTPDETIELAKSLSGCIQKRLLHLFNYIEISTNRFVGFLNLPNYYEGCFKETFDDIFRGWIGSQNGVKATYIIGEQYAG